MVGGRTQGAGALPTAVALTCSGSGSCVSPRLCTGDRGESTIRLPEMALDALRRLKTRQAEAQLAAESWSEDWPELIFTERRRSPGQRRAARGRGWQPAAADYDLQGFSPGRGGGRFAQDPISRPARPRSCST